MSETSQICSALAEILQRRGTVPLALIFGSSAKGTARPDSDIDVAVDLGHPLSADEKIDIIGDIAAQFGRPVDLVDLKRAGEPLLGQILRYGIRVLGSNAAYAELIKRHVFAQADFMPYRNRILEERRTAWIAK